MAVNERGKPSALDDLERGRTCYERSEWTAAFEALSRADAQAPLERDDLDRLAWSAGLIGRDPEFLAALERLYQAHVDAQDCIRAARAAFWIGFRLFSMGEPGRAGGWLGRAQRLIEGEGDCAERGYLMLPMAGRHLFGGDDATAQTIAAEATAVGERLGEADLAAFARAIQARAMLRQAKVDAGLALLDEAMVAATAGELSPMFTGLVYCFAIATCEQFCALGRAREWTSALSDWCERQSEISFTGNCLVHRSEVMQLSGDWLEAIREAQRVSELASASSDPGMLADASYQQGEIHRLRGELEAAEEAYQAASQRGREPQPGLALLRLAQGRGDAAVSALRRILGTTKVTWQRARFLPAFVEVMVAAGELDEARAAAAELEEIAKAFKTEIFAAVAAQAGGAVLLAGGDARGAVDPLRHAFQIWQRARAPYLAARARTLIARAYLALGDTDGGELEMNAARQAFELLGARPDLDALDGRRPSVDDDHGLSPRELEVLREVARGETNKAIASKLCISERTIDRHVSNIFTKLDVPSRAAATAFAYENDLL